MAVEGEKRKDGKWTTILGGYPIETAGNFAIPLPIITVAHVLLPTANFRVPTL
jgi:hypothetical protein